MTAPLSQEQRWRIVRAVERGSSIRQAAARYKVGPSDALKLMRRLRETGSVWPNRISGHGRPVVKRIGIGSAPCWMGESGITFAEIQNELRGQAG